MLETTHRFATVLVLSLALVACGDDETGPEEDHTPENARLFVDGADVTDGLILIASEPLRVEVKFFNDEDEEITGIDDDHHAGLTFTPSTLAAVATVDGENFQKDVTGQAEPGTGSVQIGYGHDEDADELNFGPYEVSVVVLPGVRSPGAGMR
jgi:hypothetical protein